MKLSIITINMNNAVGLRKTIESVVCQTFKDFEYIVIDGASTDDSIDIIKKHSANINYWVSEPDNGIYYAMNKGIKAANGEYCLFLNSGDYLVSDFALENAFKYDFFEDIVYGDWLRENHLGQRIILNYHFKLSFLFFLKGATISHQNSFIKRELLVKLNLYRLDFKIASDIAFFVDAIYKHGATFRYIPFAISVFDMSGIGTSSMNITQREQERNKIYSELFKYPSLYESIKSIAFYDIVWNTPGIKFWYKFYWKINWYKQRIKRLFGKDFYYNNAIFFEKAEKDKVKPKSFIPEKINIHKTKKLLVWGAGDDGNFIYNYCYDNKIFIYCFLDSNEARQQYAFFGRPVFAPKFAFENKGKDFFIVIASRNYGEEIANACRENGLKEGVDFCVPFE